MQIRTWKHAGKMEIRKQMLCVMWNSRWCSLPYMYHVGINKVYISKWEPPTLCTEQILNYVHCFTFLFPSSYTATLLWVLIQESEEEHLLTKGWRKDPECLHCIKDFKSSRNTTSQALKMVPCELWFKGWDASVNVPVHVPIKISNLVAGEQSQLLNRCFLCVLLYCSMCAILMTLGFLDPNGSILRHVTRFWKQLDVFWPN